MSSEKNEVKTHFEPLAATEIISQWQQGKSEFLIFTSGSTGQPKPFTLNRELLIWSAQQTLKYFISKPDKQLICLPLNKVGGFMQVIRAAVWNQPFYCIPPSSNPLLNTNIPVDCVISSFTPHQLFHILQNSDSRLRLQQFKYVLIGGGELSPEMENQLLHEFPQIQFVHTFGMTETYSHFAGRFLGDDWYRVTDNIQIAINHSNCLQLCSPLTQNQWLNTNDVIEIHPNSKQFKWLGRSDFTINSGGIKIQLESVEKQLHLQLGWLMNDFFCWGLSHDSLGQELTLFIHRDSSIISNLNSVTGYKEELNSNTENSKSPELNSITINSNAELNSAREDFIPRTQNINQLRNKIQLILNELNWKHPYEKPRRIEFVSQLSFTETQKLQRSKTVDIWISNK